MSSSPSQRLLGSHTAHAEALSLVVFGFLRLPTFLTTHFDTITDGRALRLTFAFTAALALAQGAFMLYGLRIRHDPSTVPSPRAAITLDTALPLTKQSFAARLKHAARELPAGFVLARHDAQVALAFAAAFAARAASIVIAAYISLRVNLYFTQHGLCAPPEVRPTLHAFLSEGGGGADGRETCRPAYVLASILSGTAQLSALLFAPLAGLLAARFSPALVLFSTSVVGAAAFPLFALRPDPRGAGSVAAAVGLGLAQISATVVSLGMVAAARGRIVADGAGREKGGALGAAYSVCGGLGILVVGRLGGGLMGRWAGAPFVLVGVVQAGVAGASAVVWARGR